MAASVQPCSPLTGSKAKEYVLSFEWGSWPAALVGINEGQC